MKWEIYLTQKAFLFFFVPAMTHRYLATQSMDALSDFLRFFLAGRGWVGIPQTKKSCLSEKVGWHPCRGDGGHETKV